MKRRLFLQLPLVAPALVAKEIPKNMEKTMKDLFASHGMEVVGPPLTY